MMSATCGFCQQICRFDSLSETLGHADNAWEGLPCFWSNLHVLSGVPSRQMAELLQESAISVSPLEVKSRVCIWRMRFKRDIEPGCSKCC